MLQLTIILAVIGFSAWCKHIYLTVVGFGFLLIRCIFLSREGGARLMEMRLSLSAAIRRDREYRVSIPAVLGYTAMISSPFYCFWVLVGILAAIVGSDGWLLYAFPTVFLSVVSFKMVSATWSELGVKRRYFWLLQLAVYLLTLLPMILLSLV